MIKALANQLKNMADSGYDQFRDSIRERMEGKITDEQVSAIKEFIFLLPPALKVLNGYWNDKSTPVNAKKLSGFIISYIIRHDDLIPDDEHGLFGYLDDAYVVVSAFLRIQDICLRDWRDKSPEEIDLTKRARELMVAPQIVIPDEVSRIEEVIDKFLSGEINSLDEYFSGHP